MKTVWLLVVAILMAALAPMCGAAEAKKSAPRYNGKPGAKIGDMCVNPKDSAVMVWVPGGEFTRGSSDEQMATALNNWPVEYRLFAKSILATEMPQRKINLNGYWMYRYEVTVAQYRKFCRETDREMPPKPEAGWKDNRPMAMVAWQDAADYAKWAGAALPTEAQWEKAARGTEARIFPWGDKWDASKCANSLEKQITIPRPVGSYPSGASPYGCMDMAGNVAEWCADWFDPNYYKDAPAKNPKGPAKAVTFTVQVGTFQGARVLRGGSCDRNNNDYLRCASRFYLTPTMFNDYLGFRCARTP